MLHVNHNPKNWHKNAWMETTGYCRAMCSLQVRSTRYGPHPWSPHTSDKLLYYIMAGDYWTGRLHLEFIKLVSMWFWMDFKGAMRMWQYNRYTPHVVDIFYYIHFYLVNSFSVLKFRPRVYNPHHFFFTIAAVFKPTFNNYVTDYSK